MKGIAVLALCLMLLCPAALGEVFIVDTGGGEERSGCALLLRDDGTALTPSDAYASIVPLTPEGTPEAERRYVAEPLSLTVDLGGRTPEELDYWEYHRVALMGGDGRLLTGFDCCGLTRLNDGSIAYSVPVDGVPLTGVMDADAHVLVPPRYAAVEALGEGRWLAMVPTGDGELYGLVVVDADGAVTRTGLHTDYAYLNGASMGLCPVYGVVEYGGKAVYVNADGAVAFSKGFDSAYEYCCGLAPVEEDGRYGLIDRAGDLVVPMTYDYIDSTDSATQQVFAAERGAELTLISPVTGEVLMRRDFSPSAYITVNLYSEGMVWVYTEDALYVLSLDGTELAAYKGGEDRYYQCTQSVAGAPVVIEESGQWPNDTARLLDARGVPLSDAYAYLFEGLSRDGESRFVCARGIDHETRKAFAGWRDLRYGVIDQAGREVLKPVYLDHIQVLSPDRYWVETAERAGMIDGSGKWYFAIDQYAYLMD